MLYILIGHAYHLSWDSSRQSRDANFDLYDDYTYLEFLDPISSLRSKCEFQSNFVRMIFCAKCVYVSEVYRSN